MPLSQHVQPELSDARMARVWGRVTARLPPTQPERRWAPWGVALGALGTVLVAVALFFVFARGRSSSVLENAALETAGDTLAVTLVDGSELTLGSRTRVQVEGGNAEAVKLVVARGQITCDVTHRPRRSFVVRASGVEVRVVGTRFTVRDEQRLDGVHVEVNVERGIVEVASDRHPGEVTRVGAGQSFSELVSEPLAQGAGALAGALPLTVGSAAPATSSASKNLVAQHTAGDDSGRSERDLTARELLDAANTARRAGDARGAADDYGQLLRRFPKDGRAGLAAFELGRLRMDRLGDLNGAVQALERAVQLAPGSGFREDAMARLVTAYAAGGRGADCRRSRDAYLSAFPVGVHRDAVSRGCGAQ